MPELFLNTDLRRVLLREDPIPVRSRLCEGQSEDQNKLVLPCSQVGEGVVGW